LKIGKIYKIGDGASGDVTTCAVAAGSGLNHATGNPSSGTNIFSLLQIEFMRFALVGDHPDGLEMARALGATGRHELAAYSGPGVGVESLRLWGLRFTVIPDLEEVLADPTVEAVLVAGSLSDRPSQLRRALQSERHVLCVHPPDLTPDIAYEATMIQADTKCLLLPLLPAGLHPGIRRLAELAQNEEALGKISLLEIECCTTDDFRLQAAEDKFSLPGWDILRAVGGEIAELSAVASDEHLAAGEPLLLAGRFQRNGLFHGSFLPRQPAESWRLTLRGSYTRASLWFPEGCPGPSRLCWRDETGSPREATWDAWSPWPALVIVFEDAVAAARRQTSEVSETSEVCSPSSAPPLVTWQTAIRSLELDDAARRSLERRRVSTLEYPEPTEEVGFKGTMTLIGCGLLWLIVLLVILAVWFPWLGWIIVPILLFFLGLQVLRWLVPTGDHK
jgi:predicted dehydrogenase